MLAAARAVASICFPGVPVVRDLPEPTDHRGHPEPQRGLTMREAVPAAAVGAAASLSAVLEVLAGSAALMEVAVAAAVPSEARPAVPAVRAVPAVQVSSSWSLGRRTNGRTLGNLPR